MIYIILLHTPQVSSLLGLKLAESLLGLKLAQIYFTLCLIFIK
jgi:hypothetical protein